jgi:hypothetical protein
MKKSTRLEKPKKPETTKSIDAACLELWSLCVIARDKRCRYSGKEDSLSAHHIRSRGHAATRYDLENGMCLSWTKFHFLQKMNPERFQDGIIDIIGVEEYERLKRKSLMICKRNIGDLRIERERLRRELAALRSDWGYTEEDDKIAREAGL